MKIGILGGSFDPLHNGHIEMAHFCKTKFKLDKIMFLPLGEPPHKANVTDKEQRIQMLNGAIDKKTSFVSRIEVDRKGKTYTYETIKWLIENTDDEYFYIIGGDTLNTLNKWYNVKELFKILEFIVVDRPDFDRSQVKNLKEMGAKLHFAQHLGLDISSTKIRQKVKNGEDISDLVPKNVKEIIEQNGLYKNS